MPSVKLMLALITSTAVTSVFIVSCASSHPKVGEKAQKDRNGYGLSKGEKPSEVKLVELNGVNVHLSSIDQNQMMYASRLRDGHAHSQIYRMNLNTSKETRITFSDGNSLFPLWVPHKQSLFYSSDTDEAKERSEFIAKNIDPIAAANEIPSDRSEIYVSDLFGNKIRRLSRSPGFDGDHDYHPSKDILAFISKRDANKDIYLFFPKNSSVQRITSTSEEKSTPKFSPDGKQIAWVETIPKEKTSLIVGWPGRKRDVLLSIKNEPIEGLNWSRSADTLHFSMRLANGVSQVFEFVISTKCLKRLTHTDYPTEYPVILGNQLYFLAKKNGKSQLGQMAYKPTDSCIDVALDPLIIKES